jgi:hypothetical protein
MASAQLDILLGALPAAPPRAGACGAYRFVSEEASGVRRVEFSACIERVTSSEVRLRLWSGDSLSTVIVADPALFTRRRGALLDYIRTVEETVRGERRVLSRADWESMPGLERIVPLAAGRDSSLGTRSFDIEGRSIGAQGKQRRESETKTRKISGIEMTQTASRVVETWTAPEAPLFGLVRGEAIIESDRRLARPIAGIPESGRRHQVVRLEWIGASERARLPARKPR